MDYSVHLTTPDTTVSDLNISTFVMLAALKEKKSRWMNNNNQNDSSSNSFQRVYSKFTTRLKNTNQVDEPTSPDARIKSFDELVTEKVAVNSPESTESSDRHATASTVSESSSRRLSLRQQSLPLAQKSKNFLRNTFKRRSTISTPWGPGVIIQQHDTYTEVLMNSTGSKAYLSTPLRRSYSSDLKRLASKLMPNFHPHVKSDQLLITTPFGNGFMIEHGEESCLVVLFSHPDTVASISTECCKVLRDKRLKTPFGAGDCTSINMTNKSVCVEIGQQLKFYVALQNVCAYELESKRKKSIGLFLGKIDMK